MPGLQVGGAAGGETGDLPGIDKRGQTASRGGVLQGSLLGGHVQAQLARAGDRLIAHVPEQAKRLLRGLIRGEVREPNLAGAQHIQRLGAIAHLAQLDDVDMGGVGTPKTIVAVEGDDPAAAVHAIDREAAGGGWDVIGQRRIEIGILQQVRGQELVE